MKRETKRSKKEKMIKWKAGKKSKSMVRKKIRSKRMKKNKLTEVKKIKSMAAKRNSQRGMKKKMRLKKETRMELTRKEMTVRLMVKLTVRLTAELREMASETIMRKKTRLAKEAMVILKALTAVKKLSLFHAQPSQDMTKHAPRSLTFPLMHQLTTVMILRSASLPSTP